MPSTFINRIKLFFHVWTKWHQGYELKKNGKVIKIGCYSCLVNKDDVWIEL